MDESKAEIHPDIYSLPYEDTQGKKILSYHLLSQGKLACLSIDRVTLKL